MSIRNTFTMTMAAAALFCVSGCCETTNSQPGLGGSVNCPPPRPIRSARTCGEVKGDFVYNLGQGAISNSSAVRLSGGLDNPKGIRVPQSVGFRCPNPPPQSYFDAVRQNTAVPPAPAAPAAPVRQVTNACPPSAAVCPPAAPVQVPAQPAAPALPLPLSEEPWEPGVAGSGYCEPMVCPVPTDTAIVCGPGENMSECFTLSEDQLNTGPQVFTPRASAPLDVAPEAPVAVPPAPEVPAAPVETKEPELPAETPQVTIPPLSVAPEAAKETMPEPLPAPESAVTEAPAPAKAEHIPPVPEVTDMEQAAEAILARDNGENSAHPEVKMPPSLN